VIERRESPSANSRHRSVDLNDEAPVTMRTFSI